MFNSIGLWWWFHQEQHRASKIDRRYASRAKVSRAIRKNVRLREEWVISGPIEFPGMRTDGVAWVASCDGLASFFEAAQYSSEPLALPSLAADSVWHAWIRLDKSGLDRFCLMRLGHTIPHLNKAELGVPFEDGISRCWAQCCRAEDINPLSGILPAVFELDKELKMPGGWSYRYDKKTGRVTHVPISCHSRLELLSKAHSHLGLTATGLMLSGGITAVEYKVWASCPNHATRSKEKSRGYDGCGTSCGLGFSQSSGVWDNKASSSDWDSDALFSSDWGGFDGGDSSCGGDAGGGDGGGGGDA